VEPGEQGEGGGRKSSVSELEEAFISLSSLDCGLVHIDYRDFFTKQ
jgi:hypothetical protein